MNIAYISTDFGVPIFGHKGASIHVREMVAAFAEAGHSIWVISPAIEDCDGGNGNGKKNAGELSVSPPLHPFSFVPANRPPLSAAVQQRVTFFPALPPRERHFKLMHELADLDKFLGVKTRIRQELRNLLYNLTLYEKARDYLLFCNIDFIYERYTLSSYAGIRLAHELGVPHILEVNAPLVFEQQKMRGLEMKALAQALEHRIWSESDKVVVVSQRLRELVSSCGVPEARISLQPNAVAPKRFTLLHEKGAEMVRTKYQLEDKCVIGFVGSLKPWHGVETLVEAFGQLRTENPQARLLIVGDGPERENLEKYAHAHGLEDAIIFTGNIYHEDIPYYIAAMDITVAPYIPNDNFYYSPIKIFEYMIMGKPVIAARIGQIQEVISEDETGVLFEPGNTEELKTGLQKLIRDAQLRRALGEKARDWVRQARTWEQNAQQVIRIADELLAKRNGFSEEKKRA
ncbi:MAG: glycosyltransferase family 4 protein [bacterium]